MYSNENISLSGERQTLVSWCRKRQSTCQFIRRMSNFMCQFIQKKSYSEIMITVSVYMENVKDFRDYNYYYYYYYLLVVVSVLSLLLLLLILFVVVFAVVLVIIIYLLLLLLLLLILLFMYFTKCKDVSIAFKKSSFLHAISPQPSGF